MKVRTSFIAFATVALLLPSIAYAVESSPSATPTGVTSKKVEDLKDRLATKVAELRQTQRKVMTGVVKSISITTLVVETPTNDIKMELPDTLKVIQYLKGKRTELTIDDLEPKDPVVVFGEFDTTLSVMTPAVILIQGQLPVNIHGTVTEVDKKGFTISVKTKENLTYIVDYEKTTKLSDWNTMNEAFTTTTFSKIQIGDIVHAVGLPDAKEDHRISAQRILDLRPLSSAPSPTPTIAPTEKPTPTTKVTPTKKPTPTVKASPTP